MAKAVVFSYSVPIIAVVLIFSNVFCEPPVSSGGWGQQQQQQQHSGGYAQQSGSYSSGYSGSSVQSSGGWGQQQQTQSLQSNNGGGGGGWGQQQVQSNNNGGWGQQSQQQQSGGGGWGSSSSQNQMKGNNGWGGQVNLELDSANLNVKSLNPGKIFRSIIGIPRKIVTFIRESGLYILFIPLIIILPLMLLAFNFGRTLGALGGGWGWSRSLSTVESGIVGYLKSPVWQKIGETLMDEKVFERIMKSLDEFNKD